MNTKSTHWGAGTHPAQTTVREAAPGRPFLPFFSLAAKRPRRSDWEREDRQIPEAARRGVGKVRKGLRMGGNLE